MLEAKFSWQSFKINNNNLHKILTFKKACSLHVLSCKVHHRVKKIESSIQPVLKFKEINFDLSLTCSDEIDIKI